ncbi:hypothetical protein [Polaribacter atrinae]|uniref:Uncharacterized protein n=1 Tax=Polaribacter atrinae TaxID=1333662 RepID=A0A176SXJ7_9FLAO|nr:hypothetical protein [Polaribacter atrinae]OAD39925.1 hypothetical protein LPB303_16975 [Polaribacter atrinae]
MISKFLQDNYESDLIAFLKQVYLNKTKISESDIIELKEYETEDYALIGIIGLILNNKPRILLGKKQPYDGGIQKMCLEIPASQNDLVDVADKFLEDDFSEESEFVLRKVMLEYPNEENSENE